MYIYIDRYRYIYICVDIVFSLLYLDCVGNLNKFYSLYGTYYLIYMITLYLIAMAHVACYTKRKEAICRVPIIKSSVILLLRIQIQI